MASLLLKPIQSKRKDSMRNRVLCVVGIIIEIILLLLMLLPPLLLTEKKVYFIIFYCYFLSLNFNFKIEINQESYKTSSATFQIKAKVVSTAFYRIGVENCFFFVASTPHYKTCTSVCFRILFYSANTKIIYKNV